ncbi:unnamed protein product [Adineta ricciae]|uniref:F5/8 type C domain-containing protein n=1 Tax=Adineta ricciae TaxID=249248 RepID=A0A813RFX5_ADIRI|nr:unnamed protein product [Adineta ricciae]
MNSPYENQQHGQKLLNIVNRGTVDQLFIFLQGFHRIPFYNLTDVLSYEGVIDDQIDFIDWAGTKYDVTPLIIAAGKGSFEKTKVLLVHGANPNKQCATGDTALNLAVHRLKYPIVDLLLQYRANPNLYNQSGKTALHRAAVSYPSEGLQHLQTLLNAGADPNIEDRNQRLPLDEATIVNKPEIVDIFLAHNPSLIQRAYRAAIIASRLGEFHLFFDPFSQYFLSGYDQCLLTLLSYGLDPNIADRTRTAPLHVAVRAMKLSTVQILVAHGADQNLANNRGETALTIAEYLPVDQQQIFINALIETPQTIPSKLQTYPTDTEPAILDVYPLLRNHSNWTFDHDEYRSQTAENSSVQNLLDDSNETFWCCTQSENAWVTFDLKYQHYINGIQIIGCGGYSAPRNGQLDVSNAVNGPWLKVKDFTCLLSQGNKNEFFFPSLETRFVRVILRDNYGGDDIRIESIAFFGLHVRLVELLREYALENSLGTLLMNDINDLETLVENRDEILNSSNKYMNVNEHFRFIRLIDSLKTSQLTFLEWFTMPQTTVIAGEKLRTFSVEGDADVNDRVRLEEKLENSSHVNTALMKDLEPMHNQSLAEFSDYIIKSPGRYKIRVVSAENPQIYTPWQSIVVGPTLFYLPKLNTPTDENSYLASTTFSHTLTTNDNEKTLVCLKKPETNEDKRETRAFITKVYESEDDDDKEEEEEEEEEEAEYDNDDDTEDDTYLTSLKSVENSPYYFPITNVSYTMSASPTNYYAQPRNTHDHGTSANAIEYRDNESYSAQRPFSNNGDWTNTVSRQNKPMVPTRSQDDGYSSQNDRRSRFDTNNREQSNSQGHRSLTPEKYRLLKRRLERLQQREQSYEKNKHQNGHRYGSYNQPKPAPGRDQYDPQPIPASLRDRYDPQPRPAPGRDQYDPQPRPAPGRDQYDPQPKPAPGRDQYDPQPKPAPGRDQYDPQPRPTPGRDQYDPQPRPASPRDRYDPQPRPASPRDRYDPQPKPAPGRDQYDPQPKPAPGRDQYDPQPRPAPGRDQYDPQPRPASPRDRYDPQSKPAPGRDQYDPQPRPAPGRDQYDPQPRAAPGRDQYDPQPRPTASRPQHYNDKIDDYYGHQPNKEYRIVSGSLVLQEIQLSSQQGSNFHNSGSPYIQGTIGRPLDNHPSNDQKISSNQPAHGDQPRPQSYVDHRPGESTVQTNSNSNQENDSPNHYSIGKNSTRPLSPPLPAPQPSVSNRYFFGPRRPGQGFDDDNTNNCIVSSYSPLSPSLRDNNRSDPYFGTQTEIGTNTSPQILYANRPGQSSNTQPIDDENAYAQLDQHSAGGSSPSEPPSLRKKPNQNLSGPGNNRSGVTSYNDQDV